LPSTEPAPRDDGELVGDYVRERTEAAFRELYRRHTPRLYPVALRLTAWDAHEAEEILQETWIRAAAKLAEFRWLSSLPTWLRAVLVNVARERGRDRRRRPTLVALDEPPDEPWTVYYDATDVGAIDLERALAELPDGFRRVVVLHDVEGLTHAEIGRLLGIEEGTSKSQLSKARRRLRERLAPPTGDPRR